MPEKVVLETEHQKIVNVDRGSAVVRCESREWGELHFAAPGAVKAGTILARDSETGDFVPFVVDGNTNGNGIPSAVLTYEVTATEAGDVTVQVLTAGLVNVPRLVIHGDEPETLGGTPIPAAVLDGLRAMSIRPVGFQQLARFDNYPGQDADS